MNHGNRIEITDREGWRKEFNLQKRICYIGSDPRNDIVLSALRGTGVAPRHLQLIWTQEAGRQLSVVNLSPSDITFGSAQEQVLQPFSAVDINSGETLTVGDFTLVFRLEQAEVPYASEMSASIATRPPGKMGTASPLGIRLVLPKLALGTDAPLEGMIYLSNQGSARGVQFDLSLEGLPQDCYEIGPAPILFPGAEKGVNLRLYHPRIPEVPAGLREICVRVNAEDSYPGESAVIRREIQVLPYFSHALHIVAEN